MSVDQAQHAIVVNIIPAKYCSMTKKCVGLPAELACTATHCGKGSTASVDTIAKKKKPRGTCYEHKYCKISEHQKKISFDNPLCMYVAGGGRAGS